MKDEAKAIADTPEVLNRLINSTFGQFFENNVVEKDQFHAYFHDYVAMHGHGDKVSGEPQYLITKRIVEHSLRNEINLKWSYHLKCQKGCSKKLHPWYYPVRLDQKACSTSCCNSSRN